MSTMAAAIRGDLSTAVPIVFLPYRIETRFAQGVSGPELWIRVYPDPIEIDTHEDGLTQQEITDGTAYWNAVWRAGKPSPQTSDVQKPWQALAGIYGSQRAAWIALQMTPTNIDQQPVASTPAGATPNPPPQYPSPTQRDGFWTEPAVVTALPDHWTVVAYASGSPPKVQNGNPITAPVYIGLDPKGAGPEPDIPVGKEMRWAVDFQSAQDAGMGIVMPLSPQEAAAGFDRILVYGVQAPSSMGEQILPTLLDHHHYTDGLSWVVQGSATNNTTDAPSALSRSDPNADISFAVERSAALTSDPSCDGVRAAQWLGVPSSTFDHVKFSDRKEQVAATQMATALWPSTLGYFLTNLLNLSDDDVRAARKYFIDNVRARGPLPAFRVGTTPYGILPVTSLQWFDPALSGVSVDNRFLKFLRWALPNFAKAADSSPRIGGTNDPDNDLVQVLGMDASASAYLVRPVLGAQFIWNFLSFQGMSESDLQKWLQIQLASTQQVLAAVGLGVAQPNIAAVGPSPVAYPVVPDQFSTVQDAPLSETEPLAKDATLQDGTVTNYIGWLRSATVADLKNWNYPTTPAPTSLLYRLLRQSLLMEYYNQAARAQVQGGQLQAAQTVEPELLDMGAAAPAVSRWEVLGRSGPVPGSTWSTYLHDAGVNADPQYVELNDLLAALDYLKDLPTAELDRLLTETLDVCSHRLDAWITSIASALLTADLTQEAGASKRFVGGYSWVENVRPKPLPPVITDSTQPAASRLDNALKARIGEQFKATPIYQADPSSGGYIMAPSPTQATAAAALRSGYLTHRDASSGKLLAIDLSSRRVRNALWIIDGIRQGQPLAALLGYQFEQGLQDLRLQQYQQPFRDKYQFVDTQLTPASPGETVAASDVVNGLALQQDWQSGALAVGSNWGPNLPPPDSSPGSDQSRVATVLAALTDIMSAIGDLSVAEGVYQLISGNPGRAGGILDAVCKGTYPPDPQVLVTPRSCFDLTHRVVVLFTEDQPAAGSWAAVTTSPRAQLDPRLNSWVSNLLPDPESVKCYLSYQDSTGTPVSDVPVFLSDLNVSPLDFLTMAHTSKTPQAGEIEQRVIYAKLPVGATSPQVDFGLDPVDDAGLISFPGAVTAARVVRDLLDGSRPLYPRDLVDASRDPTSFDANIANADLDNKVQAATKVLSDTITALQNATTAADLNNALIAASYLTVPGSIPLAQSEDLSTLQRRASAALALLQKRQTQVSAARESASTVTDKLEIIRQVFGSSFTYLPRFTPPDSTNLIAALNSLSDLLGDNANAASSWFQQLTHIRPGIARLDLALMLAQALTNTTRPDFTIGQLPYVAGASWVGLPLAGSPSQTGAVSLVTLITGDYASSNSYCGLMIDEWPERIPYLDQAAGLTFQYQEPLSRAPQAVLIAVCSDARKRRLWDARKRRLWDDTAIQAILNETLDLAKVRTVDLASVSAAGQVLPMLDFPDNATLGTFSLGMVEAE